MLRRFLFICLSIIPLLSVLTSCSLEKKLGKQFVDAPPPFKILLFPPNELYKYNHKGEDISGFDSMTQEQQDSALFASSSFIREVNDSLFLESYVNSFLTELRTLGFTVYLPDGSDSLLREQPQAYTLNMAQLQLDEYYYPFEDEGVYYETIYIKYLDLNAIDFSVWYELSKMNVPNPRKTLLYSTHSVTDGVDGQFIFNPLTTDVRYRYSIDSLTVKDIQVMATNLGRRHAGSIYDFFLNQYIAYHMPEGEEPYFYYHFNRFYRQLEPVEEPEFRLLDN